MHDLRPQQYSSQLLCMHSFIIQLLRVIHKLAIHVPHPLSHSQISHSIYIPTNTFCNPVPMIISGQGAFIVEETNYFQLCQEDLEGIPADDLEEMDINYQISMISYRAKKLY
ncbi:hypothetical protein R6Q59_010342 [Mikania micrantha]